MLRFVLIAAAAASLAPAAALAGAPSVAQVEVTIGPDLAAKADKLGERERSEERRVGKECV